MRPVTVVLCTHGVLGKHDGEVRTVPADENGEPPPSLVVAYDVGGNPGLVSDVLAAPVAIRAVTLHRRERTDRDSGPRWAYVQPPHAQS